MLLSRPVFLFAIVLGLCFAAPASAEKIELHQFSVELPKGWEFSEEEGFHSFSASGDSFNVFISIMEYENFDFALYVEDRVGEAQVMTPKRAPGRLYGPTPNSRCWGAHDGDTIAEICANWGESQKTPQAGAELAKFVAALKASGDAPAMLANFFQAAREQDVIDWLAFVTPNPAGMPVRSKDDVMYEKVPTRPYSGKGVKALRAWAIC